MNRKLVRLLVVLLFIVVVFTNACQVSTQKPTVTETLTPVPTATLTPKPTVTPTPTLTPSPTEVRSDFERGVNGDLTEAGKTLEKIFVSSRSQGIEYIYNFRDCFDQELYSKIPTLEIGNGKCLYKFYPIDEENGYDKSLLIFKGSLQPYILDELQAVFLLESGGYNFVISGFDLDEIAGVEAEEGLLRESVRKSFILGDYRSAEIYDLRYRSCPDKVPFRTYDEFSCMVEKNEVFKRKFVGAVGLSDKAVNILSKNEEVMQVFNPTPTIPPASEIPFPSENGTQVWKDLQRIRDDLAKYGAYLRFTFASCENTEEQLVVYRGSSCYIVSDIKAYGMKDENLLTPEMDYRVTFAVFTPFRGERSWYSLGPNAIFAVWALPADSDWALLPEKVFGFSDEAKERYKSYVKEGGNFPIEMLHLVGTIGLTEKVVNPLLLDRGYFYHEYEKRQ